MANGYDRGGDEAPTGRAFWSGMLTFGLVSIPVDLLAANRPRQVAMRMLAPDGEPVRRRYICPEHGKVLDDDDIVRGYEIEKGEFVLVTDEELQALAPAGSRDIALRRFVDRAELEPLRFERAYFLVPSGMSSRAYHLLTQTMEQTGKTGIATFVMRGKEYLIAVIARGGLLRGEILRFDDELRTWDGVGLPAARKITRRRVRRFEKSIDRNTRALDRDELRDERAEQLIQLAARKRASGEDVVEAAGAAPEEAGDVVDIIDLLKARLGMAEASP